MPFPQHRGWFLLIWFLFAAPLQVVAILFAPQWAAIGTAAVSVAMLAGGLQTIADSNPPVGPS